MTTISSRTILRSRNAASPNNVLSTLLLRYPRWIHAEGRTHRLLDLGEDFEMEVRTPSVMECDDLSRNAASSRAIPVIKMIHDVLDNPAIPLFWGKNQKGMQAWEETDAKIKIWKPTEHYGFIPKMMTNEEAWLAARDAAITFAQAFSEAGYHKQIVNRLLEPFSHITVLVSATEWSNFLALRDHSDAEPHIAMLAREIRKDLDREDNIQTLYPGEWHTPFIMAEDTVTLAQAIKLSVARCASTSYKTVDGFDMTLDRAIAVHDKLVGSTPIHASPCEHVAMADDVGHGAGWTHRDQHANFIGFRQYRHMLGGAP